MTFCSKCGAQQSEGAAFCDKCGAQLQSANDTPTFAPPNDDAPIFTPPTQPPRRAGLTCYHHTNEPAVAQCARCSKHICQDCAEAYTVITGEYANQCLCYDCCQALVSENVELLKKQKRKIITTFVVTLIGMLFGAILFSQTGAIGIIFGMLWIGSFWVWVKSSVSGWWNNPEGRSLAGFVGACLGGAIVAPVRTVTKIVQCIRYLIKTSKSIESDNAALVQMKDYMEYTTVMSRNQGVDLDTLLGQGSALYNNSYALAVRDRGEEAADAMLRQCTTQIAENGEIIRSFAA